MAHELNIVNGRASMFYVGEEPWHGLGTKLNAPATAAQAIKAANLDWVVEKKPLAVTDGTYGFKLEDTFAVVRSDLWGTAGCKVFGLVGKQYTPLQNREAFTFFDDIVGKKAAIYHTAGALGEGERVWILAKLPDDIKVIGDDITNKYLLLSNSHDGQSSVQIKFTPIRVVCQNTLSMALNQGPTVRVAHTKSLRDRLKQAQQLLGVIQNRYTAIGESFKAMVSVGLNKKHLDRYLELVFPLPKDVEKDTPEYDRAAKKAFENRALAEYLFDQGKGNRMQGVQGTLWAAYNGVVELIDHRQTKQDPDKRLDSVWFGGGYRTKVKAYRIASEQPRTWMN